MRLWFRGFKSSRNPVVKTSLGLVDVRGDVKMVTVDDMSGCATVQAEAETDLEGWIERADDFLTFMHRGLGFVHGSRWQTPRLDLFIGDRWEATYYEGNGPTELNERCTLGPLEHHPIDQGGCYRST